MSDTTVFLTGTCCGFNRGSNK